MFRRRSIVALILLATLAGLAMAGCSNQAEPSRPEVTPREATKSGTATQETGTDGTTTAAEPKAATGEKQITNSIGMKLLLIPAGEFTMGSPESEKSRHADEGPQHRVWITRPFYLGAYPVTQAEYKRVTGRNPSYMTADGDRKDDLRGIDTSRLPVDEVSWNDAMEFCRQLGRQERQTYRLPTEAEWEYACRAGTMTPFSFGGMLNGLAANCWGNHPYGTREEGPCLKRPSVVGSYQANAFGLYDMHGNIGQWCTDWYDEHYYSVSPMNDPSGPNQGSHHVIRGGNWSYDPDACRSAFRSHNSPGFRTYVLGFRVVRVASR